jgi:hypothetical protein
MPEEYRRNRNIRLRFRTVTARVLVYVAEKEKLHLFEMTARHSPRRLHSCFRLGTQIGVTNRDRAAWFCAATYVSVSLPAMMSNGERGARVDVVRFYRSSAEAYCHTHACPQMVPQKRRRKTITFPSITSLFRSPAYSVQLYLSRLILACLLSMIPFGSQSSCYYMCIETIFG